MYSIISIIFVPFESASKQLVCHRVYLSPDTEAHTSSYRNEHSIVIAQWQTL